MIDGSSSQAMKRIFTRSFPSCRFLLIRMTGAWIAEIQERKGKGNVPSGHGVLTTRRERDRKEVGAMCYNCGCGKPGDDMGDPKNITDKTFEEAAKASKQSPKDAKKNTLELLKIILKKE